METLYQEHALLPQLLMLDYNMPILDGISTLEQLKATSIFSEIPVLVIADIEDEGLQKRAYDLGAQAFLLKPTDSAGIQGLVTKIQPYLPVPKQS